MENDGYTSPGSAYPLLIGYTYPNTDTDRDGVIRVWTSELFRLARLPVGRMTLADVEWLSEALRDDTLSAAERAAVEFTAALVRWRRRFDIHLDDTTRRVAVGAFDIEIEG